MRVYRICPRTGDKQPPYRDRDGNFVLANPKNGSTKHHAKNAILVEDEREMIELVREGFSIRVATRSAPALVNKNIFIDGQKIR